VIEQDVRASLLKVFRQQGGMPHGHSIRVLEQAPNPSVERTHNGGARLLASPALAAPLCAAHLKR